MHSQPKHIEHMEDLTDYVTECLKWAQGRMVDLMTEDRIDDALALGEEFLAWADESEDTVYCSPDFSAYHDT
jgi:hypothetical protein